MSKQQFNSFSPLFLFISCAFVCCLLISNIIAGKLITIYGIILPAAVILFPVTYIFGDILTEVYGYQKTRLIIWIGFIANLVMSLVFMITIIFPYPPFWKGQAAYEAVLGFTPRIVAASLIAYCCGEFTNSIILSRLKLLTKGRLLWVRTIASTVFGQGVDTILFILSAFWGIMPFNGLLAMIVAQYLWKVSYEVLLTPLTYWIVGWVKRSEAIDTYDYGIRYNPFLLKEVHLDK